MSNKTGQGKGRVKPPNGARQTARARRSAAALKDQAPQVEHPGVLAAHPGPVTPQECTHPEGRRDAKNRGLCRACGTGGLEPPPARRR